MMFPWEAFEPKQEPDDFADCPVAEFVACCDETSNTFKVEIGQHVVVRLISSFDNVTWWAWVESLKRFEVMTITWPS